MIRNRFLMIWNTLLRNGNTWCSYSWVCGYHSHITFPIESTQVVQGVGSVVWSMLCFTWLGLIIYLNLHLVKQTLILSLLIYKFIWKYSPFSQIWRCLYVISLDFTITILFWRKTYFSRKEVRHKQTKSYSTDVGHGRSL